MEDEQAVRALAGWCKRQSIAMSFAVAKVRDVEVVMLILRQATRGN